MMWLYILNISDSIIIMQTNLLSLRVYIQRFSEGKMVHSTDLLKNDTSANAAGERTKIYFWIRICLHVNSKIIP